MRYVYKNGKELQIRHVYKNGKEDNVETISLYVHINIVCNPYLKLSHCDGSISPVLLIHFSGQVRKIFTCPAKILSPTKFFRVTLHRQSPSTTMQNKGGFGSESYFYST